MKKQAYEQVFVDYVWYLTPVEVLPQCKRVKQHGKTTEYQKVRSTIFWVIPYTRWVDKTDIVWYDEESVEYYECDCGPGEQQ
jgi:hypothetical protein